MAPLSVLDSRDDVLPALNHVLTASGSSLTDILEAHVAAGTAPTALTSRRPVEFRRVAAIKVALDRCSPDGRPEEIRRQLLEELQQRHHDVMEDGFVTRIHDRSDYFGE